MEDNEEPVPILLVNKKTGHIYENMGGHTFKNLTTEQVGEVTKEMAEKFLAVPVKLNYLAQKNPHLLQLLSALKLEVLP